MLSMPFNILGAKRITLGVFDNNKQAYNCYKRVGFKENGKCEINFENRFRNKKIEVFLQKKAKHLIFPLKKMKELKLN